MIRGGVFKGFCVFSLIENLVSVVIQFGGRGCILLILLGYIRGGCYMVGNLDLDLEISINCEIGISFDNDLIDVGVIYFYIDFWNKIEYVLLGWFNGIWWMCMSNVQCVCIRGMEGNFNVCFGEQWCWCILVIWMKEVKNLIIGCNLIDMLEFFGYLLLDWMFSMVFFGSLLVQYIGKQIGIVMIFFKVYILYDLIVVWNVN